MSYTMEMKKCPACGREFYPPTSEWVYRRRTSTSEIYYCSWKCYRFSEQANERKRKYGKAYEPKP